MVTEPSPQPLRVTSTAFRPGARIPARHTCDGADVRPHLRVADVPPAAKTMAVIMDDPDSPSGTWVHWLCWDVSVALLEWSEGADLTAQGAQEGRTSWPDRPPRYYGPCPGSGEHRYFFRVFALDRALGLPSGSDRAAVERAMHGSIVASGELMGTYSREK